MMLQAAGIQARLGGNTVLRGVDLRADAGEVLGLVGPNGSGKTTLLRSFYRAQPISAGLVTLDGADVAQERRRVIAQRIGVSTQESANLGGITVRESIALGRTAHRGWLEPMGAGDREIVERVLAQTGLTEFAERDAAALSGGERQRIAIARALAQEPRVLLLDEPTNHLDLRHQLLVLELLRTLAAEGLAVVVTLHDLRLAAQFCDRIAVLQEGRIVADGPTEQALTEDLLASVFGVRGRVRARPDGGRELDVLGLADA